MNKETINSTTTRFRFKEINSFSNFGIIAFISINSCYNNISHFSKKLSIVSFIYKRFIFISNFIISKINSITIIIKSFNIIKIKRFIGKFFKRHNFKTIINCKLNHSTNTFLIPNNSFGRSVSIYNSSKLIFSIILSCIGKYTNLNKKISISIIIVF